MNWPQSSYSSTNSSLFGSNQQQTPGYGTPGGSQQQQQQPGMGGGYNSNSSQQQQHQSGYSTPGGSMFSTIGSGGGAGGYAGGGLQQHTFSTSSPHHQQQQQSQQPQQQHMMGGQQQQAHLNNNMQGMNGYASSFGGGGFGGQQQQQQPGQNQMMMMSTGSNASSGYGQYGQQQNSYASPQSGVGTPGGPAGAPGSGVGRYLPGYLTASSLSGSPRQNNTISNHDGRLSPEQSHRETGGSFGAGSSRLFASSTSSAGTAGKDSPSRSPKQSLFSSSAYGSSRSLALTPSSGGSRPRRTSSNALVRPSSSHDDYMEEDAPPVDTLDDFDNDAGVPYVASPPPPSTSAPSPSKRQISLPNGPSTSSSNHNGQQQIQQRSSVKDSYKLIVFGFPPNLQSSVLKEFSSIAPLVYNSLTQDGPSTSNGPSEIPSTGSNWFTIAYDNDWAAMRALRKNGDIIADNAMIGVRWADNSKNLDDLTLPPTQQQQQSQPSTLPRSSTTSNLGTPATVLPASQAFLPKLNSNNTAGAVAMRKSATLNRINEMGKIDPNIFKQPEAQQQKQGGGVVGTLTNLIFGF